MKDLVIKGKRLKTELLIVLICFVLAFGINVFSIIKYKTKWLELLTHIHYVLLIALIIYLIVALVRLLIYLIGNIFKRK